VREFGTQTSARNSEVIHAGIYYPKDSLKARLCVEGKQLLYAYLQERHLPYQQCGKLLVATRTDQLAQLEVLKAKAAANGVGDLRLLDQAEARSLGACIALRRRVAVAFHRNRGQPRPDGFLAGGSGSVRRHSGREFGAGARRICGRRY